MAYEADDDPTVDDIARVVEFIKPMPFLAPIYMRVPMEGRAGTLRLDAEELQAIWLELCQRVLKATATVQVNEKAAAMGPAMGGVN